MTTQFIFRSQDLKNPFGVRTIIYPGVQVKRSRENDIPIFEVTDSDLIIELVIKRTNSPASFSTHPKATAEAAATKQKSQTFDESIAATEYDQKFAQLVAFQRQHGHTNVSSSTHPQLALWVAQNAINFTEEQCNKLYRTRNNYDKNHKGGVIWEERFAWLYKYKQKYNHVKVPTTFMMEQPNDEGPPIPLGAWVQAIRKEYRANRLSPDCIALYNQVNMIWDVRDQFWSDRYKELLEYKSINGHCNVPQQYKGNPSLGSWVDKQRHKYKNGKMPKDQEDRLNEVGFEWKRGETPNRDYSKSNWKKGKRKRVEEKHEDDEEELSEESNNEEEDEQSEEEGDTEYHNENEESHNANNQYYHENDQSYHDANEQSFGNVGQLYQQQPYYYDTFEQQRNQMYDRNRHWS